MPIFGWTLNQVLTPKFWKSINKIGLIRTKMRADKAYRSAQYLGGHEDLLECVGEDDFGNKYYEDFAADHHHCRRWVEYSDHFKDFAYGCDRIPPAWEGWLSHKYDDIPSEEKNFVDHFYIKEHTQLLSNTKDKYYSPGNINPFLKQGLESRNFFLESQKKRKFSEWEIMENKNNELVGNKLKGSNKELINDPMLNY